MLYHELLARISAATGIDPETARGVLDALPQAIMSCAEGEKVRTPLGTFKVIRRRPKKVRLPSGKWTVAVERVQARLRPGSKLRIDADAEASEPPTNLSEDADPSG